MELTGMNVELHIGVLEVEGRRVEVLVTTFEDGTKEIAHRQSPWDTWSRPEPLALMPYSPSAGVL